MQGELTELDILYKKIVIHFFYLIIGVFGSFSLFYGIENLFPLNYLLFTSVFFHLFVFYIPYKLDFSSIKLLIPAYLVFISIFLYPLIIVFWKSNQVTAFMWYFIIPLGSMVFFSVRVFMSWSIFILLLACSVFFVSPFVPDDYIISFTGRQIYIINIMTTVYTLILVLFFLYYLNKVNYLKMKMVKQEENDYVQNIEIKQEDDKEKFIKIYNDIIDYFEKEKPYCNPDFTISQLAAAIDSNVTYISKAINIAENVNFNILVNMYRINMIKQMLNNDYHNKYTIRHIYTSAGFRHQSTFNKAFKQIESITPSEYIKNMDNIKRIETTD